MGLRIGIVIGRIGGIDGVALETEKWISVLKKMGHSIYIITGKLQADLENVTIVPELDFHHPLTKREQDDAFFRQMVKEDTLIRRLEKHAEIIERQLLTWIVKRKLDMLLAENNLALPCHLAMGLALKRVLEKTNIPTVAHDHDYYWEREKRYHSKYKYVRQIIKECFPVNLPFVKHAVINSPAQLELKRRYKMESSVVPNVMDFKKPYAFKDDFNKSLPKVLGLKENDIPIFQVTRIVRRKGIDVAIKLIHELDDPHVKLVITGGEDDDYNADYYGELTDLVTDYGLDDRVIFASQYFRHARRVGKRLFADLPRALLSKRIPSRMKVFSLGDAYAYARACTYFSTYEGFGNAFVECILAKRPIFVNNYKPVYWPDIGSLGFETVMLNNNKLTTNAISNIKDVIYNKSLARDMAEHNFKLGKKHFSFEVLEALLTKLF